MDGIRHGHGFVAAMEQVSRRVVARRILSSAGTFALLGGSLDAALAEGTPEAGDDASNDRGPQQYVLTGGEVEIAFAPATADRVARFEYRDAAGSLQFAGDEIDLVHNEPLGQVATVLIEAAPDAYVRYLTLLVPEVNPDETHPDILIQTLAIRTTQRTSIGGPALVEGALQTYEAVALAGVAEFGSA